MKSTVTAVMVRYQLPSVDHLTDMMRLMRWTHDWCPLSAEHLVDVTELVLQTHY